MPACLISIESRAGNGAKLPCPFSDDLKRKIFASSLEFIGPNPNLPLCSGKFFDELAAFFFKPHLPDEGR